MEQALENLMEKARVLHEQKIESAEQLAASLKPLAEAMLTLTETTSQSMTAATTLMAEHKNDFHRKLNEAGKTWLSVTQTVNTALEPLQDVKKTWNTVMQEMRETAKVTSDNARKTQLLVNAGRWRYPIAVSLLVSLIFSGLLLWQMPSLSKLSNQQIQTYWKIDELEKKLIPQPPSVKK